MTSRGVDGPVAPGRASRGPGGFRALVPPTGSPRIPGGPRSVVQVLDRALAVDPDRTFMVGRGRSVSYGQLESLACRAANALAAVGVGAGDRVAVSLPNDIDIVAAFHGVLRLGALWVGVNRNLAPPEKLFILEDAGARLLIADPETAAQVESLRADLPELQGVIVADRGDPDCQWARALRRAADTRPNVAIDAFAPAAIAYTSGTTGFPKGVVHSHHNLLLPGAVQVSLGDYTATSIRGDCFPLTILNLQVLSSLLVAQAGARQVLMDRVDPQGIAWWIREERVTHFTGAPAMLYGLSRDPGVQAADLESLERVFVGGADCPQEIIDAFEVKFERPVRATYGLTEAPTVVCYDDPGEHVPGASGRPLPHLDVTIRDEQDDSLPLGEVGEVCVDAVQEGPWSGVYTPMLGYWGRADASATALRGGRLHTGDLGRLDAEGRLWIVDRLNLMIVRGGANVYPAEIERILHGDRRVAACAVVGVPDERLGERVAAFVEPASGDAFDPEELLVRCRENLARYKVPEKIVFIDSFPRNAMGKIQRGELPPLELPRRSR